MTQSDQEARGRAVSLTARVLSTEKQLYSSASDLVGKIRELDGKVHLLTPTLAPDHIPHFHNVSARYVPVNPDVAAGEVYPQEGGLALTRVALSKLASAANVSWDPVQSTRLDDCSDSNYVRYRAVGHVPGLDGGWRTIVGEKEIDLRDGSALMESMKGKPKQLSGARAHIVAMAESKAQHRAIRQLGVKQKYSKEELARKPFVVLALVLTGRHEDPEMEKMAQMKLLDAAVSRSRELYAQPAGLPVGGAPVGIEPPPLETPPPVGESVVEEDDGVVTAEAYDQMGEEEADGESF